MRHVVGCRVILLSLTVAFVAGFSGISWTPGWIAPASAQTQGAGSVSVDFHAVLDPYGQWQHHRRWGDVWIPANRGRDWRPYTHGHWGYADEWGWYWISADDERDWGWVAFHYGRWVFDPEIGWIWIPRTEWGPAWVDWRRGSDHIGWAPLPPEEIIAEVEPRADIWVFVRARDFVAPRISTVVLERREYDVFIRETVVVNRTIIEERERIAINPGIEPSYVAAAVGHPLHTIEVRPAVLAGTADVPNAVEVRANEARQAAREIVVEKQQTVIQPAQNIPPPKALSPGEKGRLGEHPPTAARQASQPERQAQQPQPAPNRAGAAGTQRRPGAATGPQQQPSASTSAQQQPGAPPKAGQAPQPQQAKGSEAQKQSSKNRQASGQAPEQPISGKAARGNRGASPAGRAASKQQTSKPEKHGAAAPKNARERGRTESASRPAATPKTGREEQRGRPEQRGAAQPATAERGRAAASATGKPNARTGREAQRSRPEQRPTANTERQHGPSAARSEPPRAGEHRPGAGREQPGRAERGGRGGQATQAPRGRSEPRNAAEQHGSRNPGTERPSGRTERGAASQAGSQHRGGAGGMAQGARGGGSNNPARKQPGGRGAEPGH